MKIIASLILSIAMASSALAGTPSGKSPIQPAPVQEYDCFAPGFTFGAFAGGMFPSHGSSGVAGGGVLTEYFVTENLGFQGSYGVYATNSEHHQIDGSIIYRMPIKEIGIAPYIMAGGGVGTNATTRGDFHAGGGVEARIASMDCMGIFVDGNYHFASGSNRDFTVVRLGLKIRF